MQESKSRKEDNIKTVHSEADCGPRRRIEEDQFHVQWALRGHLTVGMPCQFNASSNTRVANLTRSETTKLSVSSSLIC